MEKVLSDCPLGFQWSGASPSVPTTIAQSTAYNFTVYGTDLYNYHQGGNSFYYGIKDDNNPSTITWGNYTFVNVVAGSGGNPDALTFSASETGSSPGGSAITITVSLSASGRCPGVWPQLPITYV
jgi:hypothetical protein